MPLILHEETARPPFPSNVPLMRRTMNRQATLSAHPDIPVLTRFATAPGSPFCLNRLSHSLLSQLGKISRVVEKVWMPEVDRMV
jgi:hypothetical protein